MDEAEVLLLGPSASRAQPEAQNPVRTHAAAALDEASETA